MNKQLKQLTWKYFIQNKFKEIIWTAIILVAIIFIPYLLGNSIGDNKSDICDWECNFAYSCYADYEFECGKGFAWLEGVLYLFGGVITIIIIYIILHKWLSYNWKKATKRAKKELKISHKRRITHRGNKTK